MSATSPASGFIDRVDAASIALRGLFAETPLQFNDHLSRKYGARIWLKREDLSPVRSYKRAYPLDAHTHYI